MAALLISEPITHCRREALINVLGVALDRYDTGRPGACAYRCVGAIAAGSDVLSRLSISEPSIAGDLPQQFCVSATRLDGLMRENDVSRAKLLKIDAEGHELNVVKGLGDSIEVVDNIIVEMGSRPRGV
jgi:FkbM family methyltransferase